MIFWSLQAVTRAFAYGRFPKGNVCVWSKIPRARKISVVAFIPRIITSSPWETTVASFKYTMSPLAKPWKYVLKLRSIKRERNVAMLRTVSSNATVDPCVLLSMRQARFSGPVMIGGICLPPYSTWRRESCTVVKGKFCGIVFLILRQGWIVESSQMVMDLWPVWPFDFVQHVMDARVFSLPMSFLICYSFSSERSFMLAQSTSSRWYS